MRHRAVVVGLLAVWSVLAVSGFATLHVYSNTPGPIDFPPRLMEVQLPWAAHDGYQLLVAVHPRCPCTRATAKELERIVDRAGESLHCVVLQYQPANAPDTFGETALLERFRRLPNTQIHIDYDGRLAAQLNMHTSGATVLYNTAGFPEFFGGITDSRGHEGESYGGNAIIARVTKAAALLPTQASVYGCPISDKQAACLGPTCEGKMDEPVE